jgi:hypothetical protein
MAAVAALVAAPASADQFEGGNGALVEGGAIMLPLGRAGHGPSLMLHSGPSEDAEAAALWPWSLDPSASLALFGEPGAGLAHFTPRLGSAPLGRAPLGHDPASARLRLRGTAGGAGDGGRGIALSYAQPLGGPAESLALSLSAGFASRNTGLGVASAMSDTLGVSGRIGVAGFSLGGAVSGTRLSGRDTGLVSEAGGYDLDLSYSFGSGALSLSHFRGIGVNAFGRPADDPFETVSLTGRYAIDPGLDMTALLAYSDRGDDDPEAVFGNDGWALLTGFRLSF